MANTNKPDAYERVNARILAALDNGTIPWEQPWHVARGTGWPKSASTGKEYNGSNLALLAITATMEGFASSYWVTFKQAQALGGQVRKGQKATHICLWKGMKKDSSGKWVEVRGRWDKDTVPVMRTFCVFNADQCDGLPAKYLADTSDIPTIEFSPIESAAKVVETMPDAPLVQQHGAAAFYSPSEDYVAMPVPEHFRSVEDYYAVLFHELAHSTGHPSRLARSFRESNGVPATFGSKSYSQEELVAELAAAYICAELGIERTIIERSAAYIECWSRSLRKNPKWFVSAAGHAVKAADFILCGWRALHAPSLPSVIAPAPLALPAPGESTARETLTLAA